MADEEMLKFLTYSWSPFAQRVAIALKEKNIPFEQIDVDLTDKPQILLQANPIYKKVPTIIHHGKPIAESVIILQYLEDAFPGQRPLIPTDAFEKSKVSFWIDYIDKFIVAALVLFRTKPGTPEKEAACEDAVKALKTIDAGIASFSAKGPFFTGEKFGLVDVVLAPHCNTLAMFQEVGGLVVPGPDELPRFYQWMKTIKAHPSVSTVIGSAAETVTKFKAIMERRAAARAAGQAGQK